MDLVLSKNLYYRPVKNIVNVSKSRGGRPNGDYDEEMALFMDVFLGKSIVILD